MSLEITNNILLKIRTKIELKLPSYTNLNLVVRGRAGLGPWAMTVIIFTDLRSMCANKCTCFELLQQIFKKKHV